MPGVGPSGRGTFGNPGIGASLPGTPAGAATDEPWLFAFATIAKANEVARKIAAQMTVERDRALAAPRPDIKLLTPPPPPSPRAPPSERWSRMVPIMATATMK